MAKKVIGIISYMPDKEPDRAQRIERFERLLKQLDNFLPGVQIMVIAQNWKSYYPRQTILCYTYPKLGILKARHVLRERFLASKFDYLIMFDDDAIIEQRTPNATHDYLYQIDYHPDGFMFLQYEASQLNGCAISRYIYEKEPMVNIDAEKSDGFEDAIYSWLLHNKYPENEFFCKAIKCTHFKNQNEPLPSTWAKEGERDWKRLRSRTAEIKQYISEHKDMPKE